MVGADHVDPPHASVLEPRTEALVELADRLVGRDHRRQAGCVAVIHDLKQLFLGPLGAALGSHVVEDQQR